MVKSREREREREREVKREPYFDLLRGIAIIAVVSIHTLHYSNNLSTDITTLFYRNGINFAVPLFLVLSGYFCANFQSKQVFLHFLRKQIPKIYIPLLFYSFIFTIVLYIHKPISINIALIKIFLCSTLGPYYFIALIIQYYVLLPMIKDTKSCLIISFILSCISCLIIFYARYFLKIKIPLILYAGVFPVWIVFFVYGVYLSNHKVNINPHISIILIFVTYILSNVESYFLFLNFSMIGDAVTAIKITSFMYSLAVITFFMQNKNFISSKLLSDIGRNSFGIFLIHIPIIILYSEINTNSLFLLFSTIISTYIFIRTCRAVLPVRMLYVLGLSG